MTAIMIVPEAAVDKNYFSASNENEVRLPWQRPDVKCITIAHGVSQPSDAHFRRSVLAADRTHTCATLFRGKGIGHTIFNPLARSVRQYLVQFS